MYNLKEIVKAISPDNIYSNSVINDMLDIFVELLEENSPESLDIFNRIRNEKIREELVKTYLSDLWSVLEDIKTNQKLLDAIDAKNVLYASSGYEYMSKNVADDIIANIKEEHFLAFRAYRQQKGTKSSMLFINALIGSLVNVEQNAAFMIIEGAGPFDLKIEGSLPAEFYYYLVSPLSLPFGFASTYSELVYLTLEDQYWKGYWSYNVKVFHVLCLIPDILDPNRLVEKITDFSDRTIIKVQEDLQSFPKIQKWYFGAPFTGEYLEQRQNSDGATLIRLMSEDVNGENQRVIQEFAPGCILNKDMEAVYVENEQSEIFAQIEYSLESKFNELTEEIGFGYEYEERMPFLNWEALPFWEHIGETPKITSTESTCRDIRIGDSGAMIWSKPERLEDSDQYYVGGLDFTETPKIPFKPSPNAPDIDGIQYDPREWKTSNGYLAGDAYYAHHRGDRDLRIGDSGFFVLNDDRLIPNFIPKKYIDYVEYPAGTCKSLFNSNIIGSSYLLIGEDWFFLGPDGEYIPTGDPRLEFLTCVKPKYLQDPNINNYWINHFMQHSDCEFDFGVFRNNNRLEDNNISVI